MNIIKAKTAGFCFGVDRGVKMTYDLLEKGHKVATLGPLIHNDQLVADLEAKGVITAANVDDVPDDYEVVIRCHGVPETIYDKINTRRLVCHDATCPFVSKIHKIAREASEKGAVLLVAGDKNHPEVQGIIGHTRGESYVFGSLDELKAWQGPEKPEKPVYAVAQTTFQVTKWLECSAFLKKSYTNALIFDTICNATWARQQEAEDLSQKCDLMVVIGGHHSSNTQKLVQVAARHTKAVSVETAADLDPEWFKGVQTVGVTAGASTPSPIIEEVLNSMSEEIRDDMSFEEMIEASMKPIFGGKVVKGVVTSISQNEIQVDIGTKHTGFVKLSELSDDPSAKAEDLVHVGDELDLVVEKVNDQEGIAYLSKKKLESRKGLEEIGKAFEEGTVLEGTVTESNKGGVVVLVKGVKVFVPRSQATMRRDEDYTKLVKQNVKLVITEFSGHKIVGSINKVTAEANKAKAEEFWANVEIGKTYHGVVKSLTSYGAFVDIGGVDGLCHISELSWNRIKNPSEVVSVGDEIDVYVKDLDRDNKKVSLGYKKAEDNPWEKLKNEYPIGSVFTAPVVSITKFGAFVRILPGVDGLVHISEISNDRVEKVSDVLSVGDEVTVKLQDVDFDKKRISLSMKAAQENAEG
ncbi:MAG: bifunctional 4-hydroxy-3-methylbut-2-enyl diphosphate reductase/30S ribosomal protein S1 [Subdoligranulum sp.]|nr:bifunctional 4-hydroxy-3-methylbut-2-enyl diphosphate reductase/30S ribosomal protein S1 [Subdoligranulum sp.]MCI7542204.1 bifunctional 4-hydroxy-3-methylbut-2-enyl diphosphate reductase/30S ribosomal protein S1 [Subdoligranulum sp.]MDD7265115.1 bifunctional 4-hydroxy-3-methylbut-2-enyl diphosphate reductase/30S ribosomal protein S1 [Subdoligranulum sp.]MDY5923251.1 bifunctional 4-hydroxy-3-methylbut-2-enyl diphosphate reductase/30S ribosomal protein S1 [Oscillospiraceae bacterium]